jgi:hypothetical protein
MMSEDKLIDLLVSETFSARSTPTHSSANKNSHFDLMANINRLPVELFYGSSIHKGFIRFKIGEYDFDIPESWIQFSNHETGYLKKMSDDEHSFIKVFSHHLNKNMDSVFIGYFSGKYFLLLWNSSEEKDLEDKILSEFKKKLIPKAA